MGKFEAGDNLRWVPMTFRTQDRDQEIPGKVGESQELVGQDFTFRAKIGKDQHNFRARNWEVSVVFSWRTSGFGYLKDGCWVWVFFFSVSLLVVTKTVTTSLAPYKQKEREVCDSSPQQLNFWRAMAECTESLGVWCTAMMRTHDGPEQTPWDDEIGDAKWGLSLKFMSFHSTAGFSNLEIAPCGCHGNALSTPFIIVDEQCKAPFWTESDSSLRQWGWRH